MFIADNGWVVCSVCAKDFDCTEMESVFNFECDCSIDVMIQVAFVVGGDNA